ncbi:MAG: protein phosphatase 2C domain-containing protein, partial [Gemmatimonadetes bacterium]|nr:protein phosphatase 2C domain-containing protein [Gemmatimonadota bacterium]
MAGDPADRADGGDRLCRLPDPVRATGGDGARPPAAGAGDPGRGAVTVRWESAGLTDVGRVRKGNEDSFFVDEGRGVFLVADGMGGHAAGEIASALAARTVGGTLVRGVDEELEPDLLAEAMKRSLHAAHEAILAHTMADPATEGMGTTLTALVVCRNGTYRLGHVG